MPYEYCWNTKPRRRYIIVVGSNKCSSYIYIGKKYSSLNVASAYNIFVVGIFLFLLLIQIVIANISAYNKVDKEIVDAKR
jgi:hypothetical protein